MNYFTKTRILVIIIILLAITLIATVGTMVYGYYNHRDLVKRFDENPQARTERQNEFLREKLNLSDEQIEVFKSSRESFHEQTLEVNKEIEGVTLELIDEISAENPNPKIIDSLIDRYGELHKIQRRIMADHLLEIKEACRPDQFNEFKRILRRTQKYNMRRQGAKHGRMRRGNSNQPQCQ